MRREPAATTAVTEVREHGHPHEEEDRRNKPSGAGGHERRSGEMAAGMSRPSPLSAWEGEGFGPAELAITREWLRTKANSIEGGTSEVQLNIIAKRVLDLPQ